MVDKYSIYAFCGKVCGMIRFIIYDLWDVMAKIGRKVRKEGRSRPYKTPEKSEAGLLEMIGGKMSRIRSSSILKK